MEDKYDYIKDRMLSSSNSIGRMARVNPRLEEEMIEDMKERAEQA